MTCGNALIAYELNGLCIECSVIENVFDMDRIFDFDKDVCDYLVCHGVNCDMKDQICLPRTLDLVIVHDRPYVPTLYDGSILGSQTGFSPSKLASRPGPDRSVRWTIRSFW